MSSIFASRKESVDYKLLKAMMPGETVRVRRTARFLIVEFGSESEWDGEDDGTGWIASLMPLRSDLLRGDLRCLYLGWLRSAQDGGLDEDEIEPPVPAGLQELSGSLDALIEFLEIDEDLVEVAAQASSPLAAGLSCKVDAALLILKTEAYAYHDEYATKTPELYQAETLKRIRTGAEISAQE
jgi:hypothetical protein